MDTLKRESRTETLLGGLFDSFTGESGEKGTRASFCQKKGSRRPPIHRLIRRKNDKGLKRGVGEVAYIMLEKNGSIFFKKRNGLHVDRYQRMRDRNEDPHRVRGEEEKHSRFFLKKKKWFS